jgi:hypothetical protein
MRPRTTKVWLRLWWPGTTRRLPTPRVAWLVALLMAACLPEGSLAALVSRGEGSGGRQHVFRLGRSQLAPTRSG